MLYFFIITIIASLFDNDEMLLYIGYLAAEGSGQDGCLSKAACRSPNTAFEYAKAARSVLEGSKLLNAYVQNAF